MQIRTDHRSFFVFDLDDTLYREIDFLHSGFREIARLLETRIGEDVYASMLARYQHGENVFGWIADTFSTQWPDLSVNDLLKLYREHHPSITLRREAADLLLNLQQRNIPAGLITDGRSITQRNKLKALGLDGYFSDTIISEEFGSEKPDERNYLYFVNKYPGHVFSFFGDNTTKDFITPARLGWFSCCLKDDGHHIHPQDFSHPAFSAAVIQSFDEIQLT